MKTKITVKLDQEWDDMFRAEAAKRGVSKSDIVREKIKAGMTQEYGAQSELQMQIQQLKVMISFLSKEILTKATETSEMLALKMKIDHLDIGASDEDKQKQVSNFADIYEQEAADSAAKTLGQINNVLGGVN